MLETTPWLKFIPVLIPVLLLLLTLRGDKRKKSSVARVVVPLLSFAAAAVTCVLLKWDAHNADTAKRLSLQWQGEARKWQAEATHQMNRIEGRLGDPEMTQRYVSAISKLSSQFVSEQTGTSVDKFFGSKSERERVREEIRLANEKVVTAHRIRIDPVADLVIQKFDHWIAEVNERGIKVSVSDKQEVPPVGVNNRSRGFNLRVATFESGARLHLQMNPAVIEDSQFVQNLHFQMPYFAAAGGSGEVWTLDIYHDTYALNNTRPGRFSFASFKGQQSTPIEDKEFVTVINRSLDEVMGYVVMEATAR